MRASKRTMVCDFATYRNTFLLYFRFFLVRMSEKPNKAEKGKKQKNKTKERALT